MEEADIVSVDGAEVCVQRLEPWAAGGALGREPDKLSAFKLTGRLSWCRRRSRRERGRGAQWRPGVGFVGKKEAGVFAREAGVRCRRRRMRVHAKTSERERGE